MGYPRKVILKIKPAIIKTQFFSQCNITELHVLVQNIYHSIIFCLKDLLCFIIVVGNLLKIKNKTLKVKHAYDKDKPVVFERKPKGAGSSTYVDAE